MGRLKNPGEVRETLARDSILRGAGQAFSAKGYRGTTMQDIAAAAGCTPPTLYSYFHGKEDILRSLIAGLLSELVTAFEHSMPRESTFEQRLELLLARHREVAENNREAFVFLMRMGPGGEVMDLPDREEHSVYQRRLVRWMRDVQKETGELTEVPATVLALALTSLFEGFLCDWATKGGRRSLGSVVRQVKALFLHGVQGG